LQARILGGALGLSIASTVLNNYLSSHLPSISAASRDALDANPSAFIAALPPEARSEIINLFGEGYEIIFKIMTGFAAAQMLSVMLMFKNPQISMVVKPSTKKTEESETQAEEKV
jgi:hypothetical protein